MSRLEEKLYLQSVFNAIDEVYNLKHHPPTLTYEERLRASFNKLLVPNWYNHDYTNVNGLRKTKSHGQALHRKPYDYNNNSNSSNQQQRGDTSLTSDDDRRYRSQSQSWSERRPYRYHSAASSYEPSGHVIVHGRRSTSTYAPGSQRVAQSSKWYKPETFVLHKSNGRFIEPPKPRPRSSKRDQERRTSPDSAFFSTAPLNSNASDRHPVKPRAMTQIPIPADHFDEEEVYFLHGSSDGDLTLAREPSPSRTNDASPTSYICISNDQTGNDQMSQLMTTIIPRAGSAKSVSSDMEPSRSTMLPPLDKNLLVTDSSSYASVNDPSSSSYHTAIENDSSHSGYKTPTPPTNDETLSLHSSLSDLSHTETLEPQPEDLGIVPVSKGEQKSTIILPVSVGMENLPLPAFPATTTTTPSSSSLSDNSPSTESRPIESANWYDDGSIETCIHQSSTQVPSADSRVISSEEILREVDMNGAGDDFFLFSSSNANDDEPSSSFSDDRHELDAMTNKTSSLIDDFALADEFQSATNLDAFGSNHNNNNSSLMITNLDDILIDDDDDDDEHLGRSTDPSKYAANGNYRRPIQEDILYEVEHENSYSDHSQNTSSLIATDDKASIKKDASSDFLISTQQPAGNHAPSSALPRESKPASQASRDNDTLPIYIQPPVLTTAAEPATPSSLRVDTSSRPFASQWESYNRRYPDLISPSTYTPKIRNRHFAVGSYYDNKTTTVAIHPNHTFFIIGSAPVSPLGRTSAGSNDSPYFVQHHSPLVYEAIAYNTFRRAGPYYDTNEYVSPHHYGRSSSATREDSYRTNTTTTTTAYHPTETVREPILTSSAAPTSPRAALFCRQQGSDNLPEPAATSPPSTPFAQVPPLVRPKTSRGRPRSPPPPPPRTASLETDSSQNIYQEIDTTSTEDDQTTIAANADLQFIRGTIERVFDFHGESTSELSTNHDEVSGDDRNDRESISLSIHSKSESKKSEQYPAVEAVQRFYQSRTLSDSDKNEANKNESNADDMPNSTQSSTSNKLYARSHPVNVKKKEPSDTKSSDTEQLTSEEVDDTLNDIEDEDSQDDKVKRSATGNTSPESSPMHLPNNHVKPKKTSQETQTFQRQKPIILRTQSPSGSQSTIQSFETARSAAPPLDIVTQMVIERNDSVDDGQIGEITGDMVIFYDDIEIIEHHSYLSSSECDSTSTYSKSTECSKPVEPPPVPARALKPVHLLSNQQQSPSQPRHEPVKSPPTKVNRTYELEKSTIRKKFDVSSVNNMLNRGDYCIGPAATHRLPSARHFVGKLNSEDSSSRNSSITSAKIVVKPPLTTAMTKSQTLPLQPPATNGHSINSTPQSPRKNPFATLPARSASTVGTNGTPRSVIADTNALVKQLQNSLSRNSLHDSRATSPLSISTKDLRTFVSSTYSPSDENVIDDNGRIHARQKHLSDHDEQAFKRQARLSKSFHNVSEYNGADQYPPRENLFPARAQPSKSVENDLNRVSQNPVRHKPMPVNFPPIVASTSFGALPQSEDSARLMSMKWYTGQVSENSEICYNIPHNEQHDLLYHYVTRHSNRDVQSLLARLQASHDLRVHAALDDVRLRVAQFDASKSADDVHVFMRYLESRLRGINSSNPASAATPTARNGSQKRVLNGATTNGHHTPQQQQQPDTVSLKSRTGSTAPATSRETPTLPRQLGRQHLRSSDNLAGGETNGHHPPPPPRRSSQLSVNQENPAVFDEMLNTVLGLPKKGAATLPSREKPALPGQTPASLNSSTGSKTARDVGKRLFESGTLKDPRLIYDGPRRNEKEEEPLETSV